MSIKYNPFTGNFDVIVEYLKKVGTVLSPLADGDSLQLNINSITSTSTDALAIINNTAATVGAPVQMSPRIRLLGSALNTNTLAPVSSDWKIENLPVSGNPTSSTLQIGHSLGGAAYTNPMTLTSGGNLSLLGSMESTGIYTGAIRVTEGQSIYNRADKNRGQITLGTVSAGNIIDRNINDAYTALTVNNKQGTGYIQNWQFADVTKAYIDKDGMGYFSSLGLTGTRIPSGYFLDLAVTNTITGDISGNAGTVTNGVYTTDIATVTAKMLQNAAADLGAADVEVNLSNSNGAYVTNLTIDGAFVCSTAQLGTQYFGDPTVDGSWKMEIESGDLVIYKRETGSWVEKGRYE